MNRREFLCSLVAVFNERRADLEPVLRPPYFSSDTDFLESCISCDKKKCVTLCEENIIVIMSDGTPSLNFANSGCTYCDECAIACKSDVLNIEHKANINARFSIDSSKCISWNRTMCFSCKDPCISAAIKFRGMFNPEIDNDFCSSCGFCVKVCPADAITFEITDGIDQKGHLHD